MRSFFKDEISLTGNCPEKRCCVSGKKTEHLFIKDGASLKKRRCVFFLANRKAAFAGSIIAVSKARKAFPEIEAGRFPVRLSVLGFVGNCFFEVVKSLLCCLSALINLLISFSSSFVSGFWSTKKSTSNGSLTMKSSPVSLIFFVELRH